MSEETIFDPKEVRRSPIDNGQKQNVESNLNNETTDSPLSSKRKKKGLGAAGAAGIAGVAGVGLGVLTPKLVFPSEDEEVVDSEIGGGGTSGFSGHLTGHDMDVATNVDDSMSFNEAFAAARQEVGPGGLFVWHGHTYGTYYGNEWNAMSSEEKEQYWADVNYTTSHLEPETNQISGLQTEPHTQPGQGNQGEAESQESQTQQGEEGLFEPQQPTPPDEEGNPVNSGENENQIGTQVLQEDPEPLVLGEEDVIAEFDFDGDGLADAAVVDANGNELVDLVMDTTGNGSYDTLIIDPEVNDNGDLVVADENIVEIGGVEIEDDQNIVVVGDEPNPVGDDGCVLEPDFSDNNINTENPDVDDLASLTPDPEITIDNNMDMSDFA